MDCIYNDDDKKLMKLAAQAKNKSRLQELIDFAKSAGYHRLGIANCKGVQEYADKLKAILTEQGFEVISVNCKESGFDGCEICMGRVVIRFFRPDTLTTVIRILI